MFANLLKIMVCDVMNKRFFSNEGVNIPKNITYRDVLDKIVVLAYEKPNWIVTTRTGSNIARYLAEGCTLRDAMKNTAAELKLNENDVIKEAKELLEEIDKNQFYDDAPITDLDELHPPTRLHLYLTNKCNLRCIHCYMESGTAEENELNTTEWKQLIKDFSSITPHSLVSFSGGESLIRPDFFEIAQFAKTMGHSTFLFSNGTLINEDNIKMLEKYIDGIQISLDGASPAAHDAVRGPGAFEKAVNAIRLLGKTDIDINIAYCIVPQNIEDIRHNLVPFLKSLGIKKMHVGISVARTLGRWQRNCPDFEDSSLLSVYSSIKGVLDELYFNGWESPSIARNVRKRNCTFGQRFVVSASGNVHPCAELVWKIGNVRVDSIKSLSEKLAVLHQQTSVDESKCCSRCELKYICRGGCKTWRMHNHKSIFIQRCDAKRKQLVYEKIARGDII